MDGRYIRCGFEGRMEINVVNFVPGLYNFIIANLIIATVNIKLGKKKRWGGKALGYLFFEQALFC